MLIGKIVIRIDVFIDGKAGVYFKEHNVESLKQAINKFKEMKFDKKEIREHALQFDEELFRRKKKFY